MGPHAGIWLQQWLSEVNLKLGAPSTPLIGLLLNVRQGYVISVTDHIRECYAPLGSAEGRSPQGQQYMYMLSHIKGFRPSSASCTCMYLGFVIYWWMWRR